MQAPSRIWRSPNPEWLVSQVESTMEEVNPNSMTAEKFMNSMLGRAKEERIRLICLDARLHDIGKILVWLKDLDTEENLHFDDIIADDAFPLVPHRVIVGSKDRLGSVPREWKECSENILMESDDPGDALSIYKKDLIEAYRKGIAY